MTKAVIGIIGVGRMGLGIAINVQKNDYEIHYLHHSDNQDTKPIDQEGAVRHDSLDSLCAAIDTLILCVTGSTVIESIILGDDGIASFLKGKVVIDCSTAIPSSTQRVVAAIEAAGGRYLDAPMTRTPREAMQGRLNLIVGGDRSLFDEQFALLDSFAENITYAGSSGSGHTMKLLHNFVSLGFSTILAEATNCARRMAVDDTIFLEVLKKGGGAGVVLDRLTPYIAQGSDSGFQFSMDNARKDLSYYTEMTANIECADNVARAVHTLLEYQCQQGRGADSIPRLIDYLD